ncbi:MAG: xanthine dehydrogenase family protein molybdopterin-binding subunit [Pseudomonadota bacterium]
MLHYLEKPVESALKSAKPSRRTFLKATAGITGGLLIGAMLPRGTGIAEAASAEDMVTPFVHITPDNTVTVILKHLDKGQGTATGLATLVADELDASAEQVTVDFAPADVEVYKNLAFGIQGTGGSTAIANSFDQYRRAGATAKALLIAAAAKEWGVSESEISIENGVISGAGKSATFGELAGKAAKLPTPNDVTLKSPSEWKYIGKSFPRVDIPKKTTGSVGLYGMDVQLDDMVVAVTARPPRFGGKVKTFDGAAAKEVKGVVDVIAIPQGVTVIAENTWSAIQGREALDIEWDFAEAENRSSDTILAEYRSLASEKGIPSKQSGDAAAKLASAKTVVEAEYAFPFLNHAQMEPLDVAILYDGKQATFWTGSQLQTMDHQIGAQVLGLDPANVKINTLWAGGSFGRRAIYDSHYVAEAAMIAKTWGKAQPIKLVYTREDDVKGGYYRPMVVHKVKAGVDENGAISGWQHRIVGQGILFGTAFEAYAVKDGVDNSLVEGVSDTTYDLTDLDVDVHHPKLGVPVLWWRAVGHTHTAYVMETMMDELAVAAGEDPVSFRLKHLANDPRLAGVLKLAAEKAGWSTPPQEGRHRGVAVHKSFNSYVAEIAEVSMRDDGTVKVEKVVCAVDCGVPVNPDNIRAQIEGGLGYGLSAILREEVTLTDGEVDQSNYYDYLPLRITDMPDVEVHIVASSEAPTGVGEPGTPPIGPAVANAVYKATGQRVRDLPFAKHGLA